MTPIPQSIIDAAERLGAKITYSRQSAGFVRHGVYSNADTGDFEVALIVFSEDDQFNELLQELGIRPSYDNNWIRQVQVYSHDKITPREIQTLGITVAVTSGPGRWDQRNCPHIKATKDGLSLGHFA